MKQSNIGFRIMSMVLSLAILLSGCSLVSKEEPPASPKVSTLMEKTFVAQVAHAIPDAVLPEGSEQLITREAAAVVLGSALGLDTPQNVVLSDVTAISENAVGYVTDLLSRGVMETIDGAFAPAALLTTEQADRMLAACVAQRYISPQKVELFATEESNLYFDDAATQVATIPAPSVTAPTGEVYTVDTAGHKIMVTQNGQTGVYAGSSMGFAEGKLTEAQFNEPTDIALTPQGALLVCDSGNQRIRLIASNTVTTLAGGGQKDSNGYYEGGYVDGVVTDARFNFPTGIAVGEDGVTFVADTANNVVRAILPSGEVITVAGSGEAGNTVGQMLRTTQFSSPTDVLHRQGKLYIIDHLSKAVKVAEMDTASLKSTATEAFAYLPQPLVVDDARSVSLLDFTGRVTVSSATREIDAFKGMRLKQGDTITTYENSVAYLDLDSDKLLTMDKNTIITLGTVTGNAAGQKTNITLQAGAISNSVSPLKESSQYNVKTSNTTMGIRGTIFVSEQNQQGDLTLSVVEGRVEAKGSNMPVGAAGVSVGTQQQWQIGAQDVAASPVLDLDMASLSPSLLPSILMELEQRAQSEEESPEMREELQGILEKAKEQFPRETQQAQQLQSKLEQLREEQKSETTPEPEQQEPEPQQPSASEQAAGGTTAPTPPKPPTTATTPPVPSKPNNKPPLWGGGNEGDREDNGGGSSGGGDTDTDDGDDDDDDDDNDGDLEFVLIPKVQITHFGNTGYNIFIFESRGVSGYTVTVHKLGEMIPIHTKTVNSVPGGTTVIASFDPQLNATQSNYILTVIPLKEGGLPWLDMIPFVRYLNRIPLPKPSNVALVGVDNNTALQATSSVVRAKVEVELYSVDSITGASQKIEFGHQNAVDGKYWKNTEVSGLDTDLPLTFRFSYLTMSGQPVPISGSFKVSMRVIPLSESSNQGESEWVTSTILTLP